MCKFFFITFLLSSTCFFAQKKELNLKIYVSHSNKEFWEESVRWKNYYLSYKISNLSNDTVYFNTLLYSHHTSAIDTLTGEFIGDLDDSTYKPIFSCLQLNIDDKGLNRGSYCTEREFLVDAYKKLNDSLLLTFIKKIPPHSIIDEPIKAYCCPDNDKLNEVIFKKEYKPKKKYIKAQLKYDGEKELYNFPKGAKYWKGKLESNILYF